MATYQPTRSSPWVGTAFTNWLVIRRASDAVLGTAESVGREPDQAVSLDVSGGFIAIGGDSHARPTTVGPQEWGASPNTPLAASAGAIHTPIRIHEI